MNSCPPTMPSYSNPYPYSNPYVYQHANPYPNPYVYPYSNPHVYPPLYASNRQDVSGGGTPLVNSETTPSETNNVQPAYNTHPHFFHPHPSAYANYYQPPLAPVCQSSMYPPHPPHVMSSCSNGIMTPIHPSFYCNTKEEDEPKKEDPFASCSMNANESKPNRPPSSSAENNDEVCYDEDLFSPPEDVPSHSHEHNHECETCSDGNNHDHHDSHHNNGPHLPHYPLVNSYTHELIHSNAPAYHIHGSSHHDDCDEDSSFNYVHDHVDNDGHYINHAFIPFPDHSHTFVPHPHEHHPHEHHPQPHDHHSHPQLHRNVDHLGTNHHSYKEGIKPVNINCIYQNEEQRKLPREPYVIRIPRNKKNETYVYPKK